MKYVLGGIYFFYRFCKVRVCDIYIVFYNFVLFYRGIKGVYEWMNEL